MNAFKKLKKRINDSQSHLCIGLDPDISKIPSHIDKNCDGVLYFIQSIIDVTSEYAACYKPNIAFFEVLGYEGIKILEKIINYIPKDVPVILDAKRGDIGNTAKQYAKAAFEIFDADFLTVNPLMGLDTLEPYLEYEDKGIFLLALTSNPGSMDFLNHEKKLYKDIIEKSKNIDKNNQIGYVIGATQSEKIGEIRALAGNKFFLIPGIGAQGGDLQKTIENAKGENNAFVINVSREIIFADSSRKFTRIAMEKAQNYVEKIKSFL